MRLRRGRVQAAHRQLSWQARTDAAYRLRAVEYAAQLGTIEATHPGDRDLISGWADDVGGRIADVGCGPGQWTDFLHRGGHDVIGIEPVPEFVQLASAAYPAVDVISGHAHALGLPDHSIGGILAWYSLIHLTPEAIEPALAEFRRVLRPGGSLLIGFFTADAVAAFDHAVSAAWYWPADVLSARLRLAGFDVESTCTRHDPGVRAHGALTARLAAASPAEIADR